MSRCHRLEICVKVAMVGAGISGLSSALRLQQEQDGWDVTVRDKGRCAGGRMSTRRIRVPDDGASFDHGTQYLTMRDHAFVDAMHGCAAAGVVTRWPAAVAPAIRAVACRADAGNRVARTPLKSCQASSSPIAIGRSSAFASGTPPTIRGSIAKSRAISRTVILADIITEGVPPPGCVPWPTR